MKRWKCTVCGRIFEGEEPPVPCPVCKAGREAFVELAAVAAQRWKCTVCGKIFEGEEPPVPCPVCKAGREAFQKIEEKAAYQNNTDNFYVIVGGGIAGVEAAKALRQRDATASITLVSAEAHYPYNRPTLSNVMAKGLSCDEIMLEQPNFYTEHKICLMTGIMAEEIDVPGKRVLLSGGQALPYTKLLLDTGANSFNPIQYGPGTVPVRVLRSFEDAAALTQLAKGKKVVLVGGGILGLEAAMALKELSCSITVVEYAPRILSLQADEEVSARLQKVLEQQGIRVITGASVTAADASGAVLSDGTHLSANLVLASMGVRSETGLAKAAGLQIGRGIVVDQYMRTSQQDIWAAGDCAELEGRVQATATAAAAMGQAAGAAMAGDQAQPYRPVTQATAFHCPGFALFSVGSVAGQETAMYKNETTGAYRRLFLDKGRLIGALFEGANPGARAVQAVESNLPLAEALPLLG